MCKVRQLVVGCCKPLLGPCQLILRFACSLLGFLNRPRILSAPQCTSHSSLVHSITQLQLRIPRRGCSLLQKSSCPHSLPAECSEVVVCSRKKLTRTEINVTGGFWRGQLTRRLEASSSRALCNRCLSCERLALVASASPLACCSDLKADLKLSNCPTTYRVHGMLAFLCRLPLPHTCRPYTTHLHSIAHTGNVALLRCLEPAYGLLFLSICLKALRKDYKPFLRGDGQGGRPTGVIACTCESSCCSADNARRPE